MEVVDSASPPPGVDLTDNRGPEIIAVTVGTWAIAVVFAALRVVSRKVKRNSLWIDDWLIMVSLILATAHTFTVAGYQVSQGLGKHIWAAPATARYGWALGLFITEILYTVGIVAVKWSILAFYWRIFGTLSSIQLPIWALFVMVCFWGIAVILVAAFQCLPLHATWARFDPVHPMAAIEYHCGVDLGKYIYGNAVPNICTDALMIALPIPYICGLQLPMIQRAGIGCIFLVGAVVMIVSIIRLVLITRADVIAPDITWNFVDATYWTVMEHNFAIVCACLPSLSPIVRLVMGKSMRRLCSAQTKESVAVEGRQTVPARNTWGNEDGYRLDAMNQMGRKIKNPEDANIHPFQHLPDNHSNDSVGSNAGPVVLQEPGGSSNEAGNPKDGTAITDGRL